MGNFRHSLLQYLDDQHEMPEPYASESDEINFTTPGDTTAPAAPTINTTSGQLQRIFLKYEKPTKDEKGNNLKDFAYFRIYYVSDANYTGAIDKDDNSTYDGYEERDTVTWRQDLPAGQKRYYAISAWDYSRNESELSGETHATAKEYSWADGVSDYSDNFDSIKVGDGIIGLVFRQPNPNWGSFSHYKLYRDENSGSTWNLVYESPYPVFIDKGLDTATAYKYKVSFIYSDGDQQVETTGTTRDNSGAGYIPDNADNSNLTGDTFLAQNLVAVNEVRGNSLYAESKIELGGVDNTGYIKSSNYSSFDNKGFKINAAGDAEFNNITARGEVDIDGSLGGSDISNTLSISGTIEGNYSSGSTGWQITGSGDATFLSGLTIGDTSSSNYMEYSAGTLTVEGSIIANSVSVASGDVQIGPNVPNGSGGTMAGLYVNSGGAYIEDSQGKVVLDTSGNFRPAPVATTGVQLYSGAPPANTEIDIDIPSQVSDMRASEYLVVLQVVYERSDFTCRITIRPQTSDLAWDYNFSEAKGTQTMKIRTGWPSGMIMTPTGSNGQVTFRTPDNNSISIWLYYAWPLTL